MKIISIQSSLYVYSSQRRRNKFIHKPNHKITIVQKLWKTFLNSNMTYFLYKKKPNIDSWKRQNDDEKSRNVNAMSIHICIVARVIRIIKRWENWIYLRVIFIDVCCWKLYYRARMALSKRLRCIYEKRDI